MAPQDIPDVHRRHRPPGGIRYQNAFRHTVCAFLDPDCHQFAGAHQSRLIGTIKVEKISSFLVPRHVVSVSDMEIVAGHLIALLIGNEVANPGRHVWAVTSQPSAGPQVRRSCPAPAAQPTGPLSPSRGAVAGPAGDEGLRALRSSDHPSQKRNERKSDEGVMFLEL